jgi:hypothetical protein
MVSPGRREVAMLTGKTPTARTRLIRVTPVTSDRLRELAEALEIPIHEVVRMSVLALVRALESTRGRR